MLSPIKRIKTELHNNFPKESRYVGSEGRVWFYGSQILAPSTAEFFCGDGQKKTGTRHIHRAQVPARSVKRASEGAVSVFCPIGSRPGFPALNGRAVTVPRNIALRKTLPATIDSLMAEIKTSTTREDLRRVRSAGFSFRITTDPADVREFHSRYHVPLVRQQHPDDGAVGSVESMLERFGPHSELVCADLDGEWVAGVINTAGEDNYSMGPLGIRDADEEVRQKRVVSGLFVRSMQRAVELGKPTATMGTSLPFLGKGPIWFKAKWGCSLVLPTDEPMMQMLLDLRHASVRASLARSPLIHCENGELSVAAWLPPGDGALKTLVQEAGRYSGISRWYVLADPETLRAAGDALDANELIVPIEVDVQSAEPLWLGTLTAGAAPEQASGQRRHAGKVTRA